MTSCRARCNWSRLPGDNPLYHSERGPRGSPAPWPVPDGAVGLQKAELELPNASPHFYARYMSLIEQCRAEAVDEGHQWSAREVDLALWVLATKDR
jgi:hypothetical protein